VLPLVAFACVGVGAGLVMMTRELAPRWRRWVTGLGALTVACMMIGAASAWPHGLCFINVFWGGSERGYRLVSDSNYDWGQGVPELAEWRQRHPEGELDVWYFGTDPRLAHLPVHLVKLHDQPIERPDDVPRFLHGERLAVGTSLVFGQGLTAEHQRAAAFLRRRRPIDRTTTFLIYDLAQPPRAERTATEGSR
jgi:hypothetical protein